MENSSEGKTAYMGLVVVVFVVQHGECSGQIHTLKVVICEIWVNHFHRPQLSFDFLLVFALKIGLNSLMN